MSIRNSMYRMVFAFIVIPFVLFSLIITRIYSQRLTEALTESLQVVASAQVAEMTNFCEQQRDYLAIIGTMDVYRAALRGELDNVTSQYLDNMLYSRVEMMTYLNSIAIVNTNNEVIACSEAHTHFANPGMTQLVRNLGTQDFYISDILTSQTRGDILVAISRITDEHTDTTLGYAVAEICMCFYEDIRERARLWNDATFYLLDSDRNIISAGTPDENRESFITTEEERREYTEKYQSIDFQANPQGSFQYDMGGVQYVSYYSDVAYTDWTFMLSVNIDHYQSKTAVFHILCAFMILLCGVLAVVIGRFASCRIVAPIRCITNTLWAIQAEQDYSLRVAAQHQDELGNLSAEINKLIDFIESEHLYKAKRERLLQQQAERDALTKVFNKEHIHIHLEAAIKQHRAGNTALAVLFTDVDDFKAFNSNYGHNVGDQVLLFLASLLEHETCGTVGRFGGDEFLVVIEEPDHVNQLEQYLTHMEHAALQRFVVRGSTTQLPISCCTGAVRIDFAKLPPQEDITASQLINMADVAMYQVKNHGKSGHRIIEYP